MSASSLSQEHASKLSAQFGADILGTTEFRGETTII